MKCYKRRRGEGERGEDGGRERGEMREGEGETNDIEEDGITNCNYQQLLVMTLVVPPPLV